MHDFLSDGFARFIVTKCCVASSTWLVHNSPSKCSTCMSIVEQTEDLFELLHE